MQTDDLFENLRMEIYDASVQITDEDQLLEILGRIAAYAADDLGMQFGMADDNVGDPAEMVATIDGWASLASHATYHAYVGPYNDLGAMQRRLAGWSREVAGRLRYLADLLGRYLEAARSAMGALSYRLGSPSHGGSRSG